MSNLHITKSAQPEILLQFFKLILRNMAKGTIKKLIISVCVSVFVFLLQLILIDGSFSSKFIDSLIAVKSSASGKGMVWTIGFGTLISTIAFIRNYGKKTFSRGLSEAFAFQKNIFSIKNRKTFFIYFFISILIALITQNPLLCLILAGCIFLSLSAGEKSQLVFVSRLVKSDYKRIFKAKRVKEYNLKTTRQNFCILSTGLMISGIVGFLFTNSNSVYSFLLGLVLVLLILTSVISKRTRKG